MKKFNIIISSDKEYDDLCAEIYYEEYFVAILTQEKGIENLEVEIYTPLNAKKWKFNFSEFIDILESAKTQLGKMRKSSDE